MLNYNVNNCLAILKCSKVFLLIQKRLFTIVKFIFNALLPHFILLAYVNFSKTKPFNYQSIECHFKNSYDFYCALLYTGTPDSHRAD